MISLLFFTTSMSGPAARQLRSIVGECRVIGQDKIRIISDCPGYPQIDSCAIFGRCLALEDAFIDCRAADRGILS